MKLSYHWTRAGFYTEYPCCFVFFLISNKPEVALEKNWNRVLLYVYRHCSCKEVSAARRPDGELIKDLLLATPPRTWRGRTGDQLKAWANTIKPDLEPLSGPRVFGYAQWNKDWVQVSSELAQDRRGV